ncbi:mRNA decay activator protein ZFP36L2-A [Copidosoma floridanum]|uniref:mRNA decay activator protein ZFP36L2-A n=1 Tax=Copidosoma floridanum TaxID=29053 RepID=UPI0006C9B93A|nr:mRNA decay activator protein ZFP36L2-A [Copidosoma floridanum]XP_014207288.1 mRNA decay activator protein ZFP36L2-A [Copidosoma floridanum]
MSTAVMSSSQIMFDYFKTSSGNINATNETAAAATAMVSQQVLGALTISQTSTTSYSSNNSPIIRRSYNNLVNLLEQHRKLDRSVSEPTSRYKTELCRPFEESGSCKYGDKCQFAHGYSELRNLTRHPKYKTELCRTFHKIGFCPYGPRCHFVHNFEEARVHNLKLTVPNGDSNVCMATEDSGPISLSSLLQPFGVGAALIEQLTTGNTSDGANVPLVRASSLSQVNQLPCHHYHHHYQQQPTVFTLPKSSSFGLSEASYTTKPTTLNLSPTFSLGSVAESISPTSSLSQSPTNSMTSFFGDESASPPLDRTSVIINSGNSGTESMLTFTGLGQKLVGSHRCTSSPPLLDTRTQAPLSPGAESRLPIFNQISSTVFHSFDNLKI